MKTFKLLIAIVILFSAHAFYAQNEEILRTTKTNLDSLKTLYDASYERFEALNDTLLVHKAAIGITSDDEDFDKLKQVVEGISQVTEELNGIKKNADVYVNFFNLELNDVEDEQLKDLVNYFENIQMIEVEQVDDSEPTIPKVLYYFGKDEVIAENDTIFNDPKYDRIFKTVLSAKSKSYLGDFVIPQDGQKLKVELIDEHWLLSTRDKLKGSDVVHFNRINLHVEHGLIQDIKVIVLDSDGNELLFENRIPVSLLNYSRKAPRNNLFFRTVISNNKNKLLSRGYKDSRLRLSDVLMYINNPGENYVPDDLRLEFPTRTDGKLDNSESSLRYKIEQNTSLENVLNLRAYTDFLGLFGDSPNGLVQIEGKADFYLAPFNYKNTHNYFFKKVSPYIHYARLDEEQKNVNVVNDTITNNLEILEKSFLNMGLDLDVWSFKLKKEFPFEMTFYGTARYNISNVEEEDNVSVNYKSLSLGGGLRVDIKRFNNFGLTLRSEVTKVNTNELNTLVFIENPDDFSVFRNEAEIYYHPAENKNQALFLRLTTFGNSSAGSREAFYQLQFGYKFSIGVSKLKQ